MSYAFGDGSDAARRLALVHLVFVPLAERLLDDVARRSPDVVADLGRHQSGILQRSQVDEPHAIRKRPAYLVADPQRQPRLPYPAGTGQGHQARRLEQPLELGGLTAPQAGVAARPAPPAPASK